MARQRHCGVGVGHLADKIGNLGKLLGVEVAKIGCHFYLKSMQPSLQTVCFRSC